MMKKNIFLALIAFSMSLTGCGKDKDKDNEPNQVDPSGEKEPEGPVDPLTPEQRAEATKTNDYIYDRVKEDFSEEIAEGIKEYILTVSEESAVNGASLDKVTSYIDQFSQMGKPDVMTMLGFVMTIGADQGLDDTVYFAVSMGKVYLKANAVETPEMSELFTSMLNTIEAEGVALPNNVIAILDTLYATANKAVYIEFFTNIMPGIAPIMSKEPLDPETLKPALQSISGLLKGLGGIKENVKYLANFAKNAFKDYGEFFLADEAPLINGILSLLDFNQILDAAFGLGDGFADFIGNLPDTFYVSLEGIEDPYESYITAGVGLLAELIGDIEVPTQEEIEELEDGFFDLLLGVFDVLKDEIQIPTPVVAILESESFDDLYESLLGLGAYLVSMEYDAASLENVVNLILEVSQNLHIHIDEESVEILNKEDFDAFVEDESNTEACEILPISDIQNALESSSDFDDDDSTKSVSPIHYGEEGELNSMDIFEAEYDVVIYPEIDFIRIVYQSKSMHAEFGNLDCIPEFAYSLLSEMVLEHEVTDGLVEQLGTLVKVVNDILGELVVLDETDDSFEIPMQVPAILGVVAQAFDGENKETVKLLVNDLLKLLKELVSEYVPFGDDPAFNDFTFDVVVKIIEGSFGPDDLVFEEEKFEYIKVVVEDIYELADSLTMGEAKLSEMILATLSEQKDGEQNLIFPDIMTEVTDAESFAAYMYPYLRSMVTVVGIR